MTRISTGCMLLTGALLTPLPVMAGADVESPWPELSLGDLMKVGIESASRKSQSVSETAASIFVISAADIHRSGALTLPEVLRLAPGVEAARQSNNKWAISIRGFNGRMANKLLVLVDGRSLYSSLYGGILWEAEHLPLEDISRIEVIRGPADVAWGSNAVNGVINIITKRTQDTTGWAVDSHAGTSTGQGGLSARYGKKFDDTSAFRVTLDRQWRADGDDLNGAEAEDQWNDTSLNFRYDKPVGADTRYLVSGRVFDVKSGDPWMIPTFDTAVIYGQSRYGSARLAPYVSSKNGGHLLGRLEQTTEGGGEIRIQTYVEKFNGQVQSCTEDHTTLDLEGQHHFPLASAHDLVWGGNYRETRHHSKASTDGFLTTTNPDTSVVVSSVFAQDEWTLVPHLFNLQAGLRFEHQTFGGTSPLPSVRALWTPSDQHTLWLAWSKAVRSPSIVERDMGAYAGALPAGNPVTGLPTLIYARPGSQSNFGNEHVRTLEAGHRAQWTPEFFSDFSAYVSHYDGVFGVFPDFVMSQNTYLNPAGDAACTTAMLQFGLPAGTPGLCMTVNRGNAYSVRTRGMELATEWNPTPRWRLQFNVSRLWVDAGADAAYDENSLIYGSSPKYQGSLRSSFNLSESRQFDFWLRHIDGTRYGGYFSGQTGTQAIPARNELDLRFAQQLDESLELSLVLQNLLSKNELQAYPDYIPSLLVVPQRAIYLRAVWRSHAY